MNYLVLIKKTENSSDCWPNLVRKKKVLNLSVEEVISAYNGFEGDLIFIKPNIDNEMDIKKVVNQHIESNALEKYLLLIISPINSRLAHSSLHKQAFFLGYDVGVCQGVQSVYSSIFNEILFGIVDELIYYKIFLNNNFLFPNRALAESYVKVHNEMSVQGKDVEDYMEMIIYEIWRYKLVEIEGKNC